MAGKKVKPSKAAQAKAAQAEANKGGNTLGLAKLALEINHRLEQAAKMESDAFDHRLSACIRLDEARKDCAKQKIPFKAWCEVNVEQSYETVRALVRVGGAGGKAKVRLALEDLRAQNARRNRESRERARNGKSGAGTGARVPVTTVNARGAVAAALGELSAQERVSTVRETIGDDGFMIVSKAEQAKTIKLASQSAEDLARHAWSQMHDQQRRAFAVWCAGQLKGTCDFPPVAKDTRDAADLLAIPANLKREDTTKTKTKTKAKK
jgi:hypothetical protein